MADHPIARAVADRWLMVGMRGLLAVFFGILALLWPGLTLAALVFLFGAYALVDGVFALVVGVRSKWWSVALMGVLGVVAGIVTFLFPGLTALSLLYLIAAWAIVRGVFEIVAAIRLRREITNEWLLILSGIASIAFGVLLFLFPGAGALSVVWVIGAFALWLGILLLFLAFRLKKLPERVAAAGTVV
jgi:uncharacterized membrane protein HdeD (DUF308 family)